MKYATVCSGIGAPEATFKGIFGLPEFVSEIDKFPSAVLKHHMPDVPNYGDMTKYNEWPEHDIDMLIGGTPCQAFSVAGLRRSLEDDRGNLTLTFIRIADRYNPKFTIWENVPGVLNTKDNAFGQFLSGLTGYDTELSPRGGRWSNAGFVVGPKRVAAWRILDAQHFGVPQRRRRVFVISSPREFGFAPCQVLFEPEGMSRDIKTGRKEGQGVAGFTSSSIGGYSEGCGTVRAAGGDVGGGSETLVFENHPADSRITGPLDKANTVSARYGTGGGNIPLVMASGHTNAEIAVDKSTTLTARSYKDPPIAFCQNQAGDVLTGKKMHSLATNQNATGRNAPTVMQPICVHPRQTPISSDKALPCETNGPSAVAQISPTLGKNAYSPMECSSGQMEDFCITQSTIVRRLTPIECERLQGFEDNFTLIPWGRHKSSCAIHAEENDDKFEWEYECDCGYPRKPAPDGPRYKALGNSMAVPVLKWIGERIQMYETAGITEATDDPMR